VTYYDDVRLVFDEYRKRFCILSSGGADKSVVPDYWFNRSVQVLAVCVSQNPLDGWYLYWWDAAVGYTAGTPPAGSIYRNSDAPDYPNLGVSPGLVVATARISTPCTTPAPGRGPAYPCSKYNRASPDHPYWHAVFLDGEHLSEGRPGKWVAGWHFWDITSPDGGSRHLLQPAVHHGPSDATWLVSAEDSPSKFAVFRLTDALTAQQKLDSTEVALNTASYPKIGAQNAPQLGGAPGAVIQMANVGAEVLKAVFRSPNLYLVTPDSRKWGAAPTDPNHPLQPSIRFTRVRAIDFPSIGTGSGYVDRLFGGGHPSDKPDKTMGYGWPAVEVNNKHDAVIVYARSGSSIYPEARYNAYLAADTDIRSSNRLKKGEGAVAGTSGIRWGDNAGACVDPSDDDGIWITQQYANNTGGYDVWVGKIFGAAKRE
jgi:hypothetical protein